MALSVLLESGTYVLTVGGNAITCATEFEINEEAAVYRSQCDGTPVVQGFSTASGTMTCEIPLATAAAQLGYLATGPQVTPQALVLQPGGATATYTDIDAANIEFTGRTVRYGQAIATVVSSFVLTTLTYTDISA